ncbi:MAG: anthranilate synthase component, partial [Thermoplasmata archaeon]|nr:anthranilate synthase component [Thermoplasmata archaeon]
DWVVDARLADGTIMAIRHATHPSFGLQFHPESIGTEHGLDLLDAFLAANVLGKPLSPILSVDPESL